MKLRDVHKEFIVYVIEGVALTQFEKYHESLVTRQGRQSDQGILSKACGFAARCSMILFALEQALNMVSNGCQ